MSEKFESVANECVIRACSWLILGVKVGERLLRHGEDLMWHRVEGADVMQYANIPNAVD